MSMRLALLASCVAIVACSDVPAPPNLVDTSAGAETGASTSGADSTTTAGPESVVLLDASLDFELRETIDVEVVRIGTAIEVTLNASVSYGVVPTDAIVGPGRIDAYPEIGATLYTATFDAPAQADGPCGDQPISLGFSLHKDDESPVLAGGLTAYCGAATFFGVPVIEPLRIFGRGP